tara:strand:- start:492 stop:659 length:168 start_codon:yes stop_codon:yes gene_type:complete
MNKGKKILKAIAEAAVLLIKGSYLILGCMIIIPIVLLIVSLQYVYESAMVKIKEL